MTRNDAFKYVGYFLDDSLNVCKASDMPEPCDKVRLVGWQCGFEPMFVAVWSYLPNVRLGDDDAIDIAKDYLEEIKWFSDGPCDPDYIL